jgi:predicted DNA-binding protein
VNKLKPEKVKQEAQVRVSKITRLRLRALSDKQGRDMINLADEAIQKFCEKQEGKK